MVSEKVWKWHWDCGRMGSLTCLFVATEKRVKDAIGNDVYFGEVLGKHSEVYGTLGEKEFVALTEDPAVVAFVKEHGPFGLNPLNYMSVECGECGNHMSLEEEQDYWCHECEVRLCGPCTENSHADHNTEDYDQCQ